MEQKMNKYENFLREAELSESTISSYMRAVKDFNAFLGERNLEKQVVLEYKKYLQQKGNQSSTMNLYIIAINKFVRYCGEKQAVIKTVKCQSQKSLDNIINEDDYKKLLQYAVRAGQDKYYLIMKTMAVTGIRVSELRYITKNALERGYTRVNNKGKIREIYLPESLTEQLTGYCRKEGICEGVIFRGNSKQPISRNAVWKMLRKLADKGGEDQKKVFPHSFRHFFALSYMKKFSNIFELADILGHANLETTRIYTTASIEQKRQRLEQLDIM